MFFSKIHLIIHRTVQSKAQRKWPHMRELFAQPQNPTSANIGKPIRQPNSELMSGMSHRIPVMDVNPDADVEEYGSDDTENVPTPIATPDVDVPKKVEKISTEHGIGFGIGSQPLPPQRQESQTPPGSPFPRTPAGGTKRRQIQSTLSWNPSKKRRTSRGGGERGESGPSGADGEEDDEGVIAVIHPDVDDIEERLGKRRPEDADCYMCDKVLEADAHIEQEVC